MTVTRDRAPGSTSGARLLVAEDEPVILELIAASLRHAGFDVVTAPDGNAALTAARTAGADALILDVMMPGLDGFDVVRRLRAEGDQTPVLFLTAKDSTDETVRGLEVGGDDYVTKPFKLEEVLARVHALLRRAGTRAARTPEEVIRVGDIELDEARHLVRKDGVEVDLTPTEFKLLLLFLRNPDRVLSKAQILDQVWEYDFGGDSNIVESYVSYLRRKVDTSDPRLIQTVRGVGYRLRPPVGG
ncbi:MAG: putative transcriptional regulatory protein TcrX [Actinomycetota bacterium]